VHLYLGLSLFAFALSMGLMVPFIGLLYKLKFTRKSEMREVRKGASVAFHKIREMHAWKEGVPTGGGILVAAVVMVLFALAIVILKPEKGVMSGFPLGGELIVIFVTFLGFGLLGFYDDLVKIFGYAKSGFFGLRMRHKFIIQWIIALVVALLMYLGLGIDIVNIPFLDFYFKLGWMYVPLAAFLIVGFANAFDFTDGLDGLSCGLLFIFLVAFLVISLTSLDHVLGLFISLWIGALIAFLYFNIYPARIMLGNTGGLAFGATIAVIGLLTGKIVAMLVIGGIFVAEGLSSLIQLMGKKFLKKRIFPIAPLHHWLQLAGWEEPKIVARAWMAGLGLAIFGVWLAVL
jgi:phospho-N-acetylmuramoyl-pentapeptide-transferase